MTNHNSPKHLWALVMAGGSGKRLWPLSTQAEAKPFLKLIPGKGTLLEETLKRISGVIPTEKIWVIGSESHLPKLRELAPQVPAAQILGEPYSKNTAATVGLAAKLIAQVDPEGLLLVLPADQQIRHPKRFHAAIRIASEVSRKQNGFSIFGIEPEFPSSSYGYLELGKPLSRFTFGLKRFVEKPTPSRARGFLRSGRFLWHAGIFVAPVEKILESLKQNEPHMFKNISKLQITGGCVRPKNQFARIPSKSIDYAVLERLKHAFAIRCKFGWNDVGTWDSLAEFWGWDSARNASFGRLHVRGAKGNLVCVPKKRVCLNEVDDLVIVDTQDTLFISRRGNSEKLRSVVEHFTQAF